MKNNFVSRIYRSGVLSSVLCFTFASVETLNIIQMSFFFYFGYDLIFETAQKLLSIKISIL